MLDGSKIGQRLASLRKEKGYTQEQLAGVVNVTAQAVSKWETGNALPDTALLPVLAKVLETSIDRLLTGSNIAVGSGPYDREYEKAEYYWGLKHSDLAEQVIKILGKEALSGKRLLEIGSGEGRDSIYFARCGFSVDSLEISLPGIKKIEHYSEMTGCSLNAIHADMIDYELTDYYDVVYSMGALQFLPQDKRRKHFERYKRFTNIGGLNAHLIFVEKPFIDIPPDWGKNEFFYQSGELAGFYRDWEIIHCEEQMVDCTSADMPHKHALNYIIAKKVSR